MNAKDASFTITAAAEGALKTAEDFDTRIYHPAHNKETGGPFQTIFLSQLQYWWHKQGREPFYKFLDPAPDHGLYKDGQSWSEELGISRRAIGGYCKTLGRKLSGKERKNWRGILADVNRKEEAGESPVYFLFWTNRSDNRTFWVFNDDAYLRMRIKAYGIDIKLLADMPVGMEDMPVGMEDMPVGMEDMPVGMEDMPALLTETTQRPNKDQTDSSTALSQSGQLLSVNDVEHLVGDPEEEYKQRLVDWMNENGVSVADLKGFATWQKATSNVKGKPWLKDVMKEWPAFLDDCQVSGVAPSSYCEYAQRDKEQQRDSVPAPAHAPSGNPEGIAKVQAMLSGVLNGGNGKNAAREAEYQRLEAKIKRGEELTQEECSAYMAML